MGLSGEKESKDAFIMSSLHTGPKEIRDKIYRSREERESCVKMREMKNGGIQHRRHVQGKVKND